MFYQHFQHKSAEHQDRAQSGIVLAMSKIKRRRKMRGAIDYFSGCSIACEAWQEARHFFSVPVIFWKCRSQIFFFRANHRHIDESKHGQRTDADPDIPGGNNETYCNDDRAKIERITRVIIRTGSGKLGIFAYVSRSKSADENAYGCHGEACAQRNPRGPGEPKICGGKKKAERHTRSGGDPRPARHCRLPADGERQLSLLLRKSSTVRLQFHGGEKTWSRSQDVATQSRERQTGLYARDR